jgi:predicted transposase YdaD
MDDETVRQLWSLREVNKALTRGLETVLLVMEKWDEQTQEKRQIMIEALRQLISQSEEAYGEEPSKH